MGSRRWLTPEIKAKARSLVSQMTLEEKVGQMSQFDWGFHAINPDAGGEINELMKHMVERGLIGSLFNISGVEEANELQKKILKNSRLGIPMIIGRDVIHGYRTVFPIPLAMSSSWNPAVIEQAAAAASREAAADGIHWVFAPMIDITRDPRWGRIAESPGEDPYLGGRIAEAWVRGAELKEWSAEKLSVASCPKHYAGYGFAEAGRDYNTVDVSDRVLREVILPPFRMAVEAGALSIMASFNELDGIPACANRYLLTTILREEWGFEGIVVSDYNALLELIVHGVAKDPKEAAELAIKAGTDMDMHSGFYFRYLPELVEEGRVDIQLIDQAVERILAVKIKLGLFDKPFIEPSLKSSVILSEEHISLARQAARESIVLLHNDNHTLPLSKEIQKLALIGPMMKNRRDQLGCWALDGREEDVVSLYEGITAKLSGSETEILYAEGCGIEDGTQEQLEQALAVIKQADAAVIAVGEALEMSGEGNSRAELDLPGKQRQLVEAASQLGKPLIVVLMTGRPLVIGWLEEHADAIVQAWHLGVQSGHALADVLFGDVNPSGRLPVTFPRSEGQIPIYYYRKNTGRPPGGMYTSRYIDMPAAPLYPFGFGLSYTEFTYQNLRLDKTRISGSETLTVTVDVTNAGERAGEEVVQLYIRDLTASVTQPLKRLKGFAKVKLEAGETKEVSFPITAEDLAIIGRSGEWAAEPGEFLVIAGPNAEEGLEAKFEYVE